MKKIILLMALVSFNFGSAQFLEDFNGTGAVFPPANWAVYDGANGQGTTVQWDQGGTDPEFFARCIWEAVAAGQLAEDWLVTPQIPINATQNELRFEARDFNTPEYGSILSVRISTSSQTDTTTFTEIGNYNETALGANAGFQPFIIDLTAYLGQSVYIAFVHINNDGDAVAVDNVSVEAPPACDIPLAISLTDFTSTTADVSWTNSGNFDIVYGEFPFALRDPGATTATVTAGNTYQLTNLTPGVSYNVFVRQDCGNGLTSDYEEIIVGTTPIPAVTFPFSEDLEADANQALLLNLGMSFLSTTGSWTYGLDNLTDGNTTNDFAFDGAGYVRSNSTFTDADSDATIFFGPFTLADNAQYTFSFQQRNLVVSDATTPAKDIEIVVATTNDGTTNTVIATFDDMNNIVYQSRSASFTAPTMGDYYFGIRDKTNVLTGVTAANVVYADALSITTTLSVDDFSNTTLNYFYSKNTNSFNVEISEGSMDRIEVYNLLGQQITTQKVDESQTSVDMSSYSEGVYVAKVYFEGTTQSIKFIK